MFPKVITMKNNDYYIINDRLTAKELKEVFRKNPYEVYAIVNESIEGEGVTLTTFLVLYSIDFGEHVLLYDVSNQLHTNVSTEVNILAKGYVEDIDIGIVDRFDVRLYIRRE